LSIAKAGSSIRAKNERDWPKRPFNLTVAVAAFMSSVSAGSAGMLAAVGVDAVAVSGGAGVRAAARTGDEEMRAVGAGSSDVPCPHAASPAGAAVAVVFSVASGFLSSAWSAGQVAVGVLRGGPQLGAATSFADAATASGRTAGLVETDHTECGGGAEVGGQRHCLPFPMSSGPPTSRRPPQSAHTSSSGLSGAAAADFHGEGGGARAENATSSSVVAPEGRFPRQATLYELAGGSKRSTPNHLVRQRRRIDDNPSAS
jgi:hypothetical protein